MVEVMVAHRDWRGIAAVILLCSACTNPSLRNCGAISREYIVRDGRVVLDETADILTDLDLELQFKIYHCSARHSRPSLTDLAPTFASQGEPAAVFLVRKMRQAPDDATILSVVELLEEMKHLGVYDVGRDAASMALLQREVQDMRDAHQRMLAQSAMRMLGSDSNSP